MAEDVLKTVLKTLCEKIIPDVVLINAAAGNLSELDSIQAVAPETPTIIYGFETEKNIRRREPRMALLLTRPRTVYLQLPCETEALKSALEKLARKDALVNTAAERSLALSELDKKMGQMKHLIDHPTPDRIEKACRQAREELGWTGTNKEIMDQIRNFKRSEMMKKEFSDKVISGVFCDIQGTLMDYDAREIQPEVLEMLKAYEAEGKTISLWSGGELKDFRKRLAELEIIWPLLSKYDFEGCVVEIAVDDIPAKKLEKEYGIKAEHYVLWDPDGIWS